MLTDPSRTGTGPTPDRYTEVWGEDFWHTYSPTLGCDTLFSSLAYAASCDLKIHHLDAVSAYLNSNLHEEIYL